MKSYAVEKWKKEKELKEMEGAVKIVQLKRKKSQSSATAPGLKTADSEPDKTKTNNKNKTKNPFDDLNIPKKAEENFKKLSPKALKRKIPEEKKGEREKKKKVS